MWVVFNLSIPLPFLAVIPCSTDGRALSIHRAIDPSPSKVNDPTKPGNLGGQLFWCCPAVRHVPPDTDYIGRRPQTESTSTQYEVGSNSHRSFPWKHSRHPGRPQIWGLPAGCLASHRAGKHSAWFKHLRQHPSITGLKHVKGKNRIGKQRVAIQNN